MKLSLLEMVQDILSEMDSDEVNSINDTVESVQVAQTIKTCYFEIIGNRNWPHLRKLIQVEGLATPSMPNYLRVPEDVKELVFFKYDKRKLGDTKSTLQDVLYKEPDSFLRYVSARNSDNTNVDEITDFSGSKILVLNDVAPTYWTTFDDQHIVTDSYDAAIDTTLQQSKTQALAYVNPTWSHVDAFIPNLPIEAFPALLAESKSTCFFNIKQMPNQKTEQKSARQQRWLSRKAWKTKGGVGYQDFGRKSRR